jgi:dihydrofolate synthase/folylpolyglutamate synthase
MASDPASPVPDSSQLTTYEQALGYLDSLQMHKIKLGLDAIRQVLARLGSPERGRAAVHVAGTNGKGSVCRMVQAILSAAGYRTGLYTSPHLSSIRERFSIDGVYIDKAQFTDIMAQIHTALAGDVITYFECTTALAFCWFARQNCDVMILETGMGGRLDATNVVDPLVAVITSIGLDHQQYLGETITEIAGEKAGIIKTGRPVISAVEDDEARRVIEQTCAAQSAPLITNGIDFALEPAGPGYWHWRCGSTGFNEVPITSANRWQPDNVSCALAVIHSLGEQGYMISDTAIATGLRTASWPGRMELLSSGDGHTYLLDGAHNEAGLSRLLAVLEADHTYRRLVVIWGAMGDKEYQKMLDRIAGVADTLILTRPDSERAATPAEMRARLHSIHHEKTILCQTVAESLTLAANKAGKDDLILVAGSLYLVGEARPLLAGELVDG